MDLQVITEVLGGADKSWLRQRFGMDMCDTITLAINRFTANTHYPNGYIPSGTVVAQYTSGAESGLYGPYVSGATDGGQTPVGFLLNEVRIRWVPGVGYITTGVRNSQPLLWTGVIRVSRLPANSGLDSGARTALASKFRFE